MRAVVGCGRLDHLDLITGVCHALEGTNQNMLILLQIIVKRGVAEKLARLSRAAERNCVRQNEQGEAIFKLLVKMKREGGV